MTRVFSASTLFGPLSRRVPCGGGWRPSAVAMALPVVATVLGCGSPLDPPQTPPTTSAGEWRPASERIPGVDPAACSPGAPALHRLNRREYDQTVRDLLGVETTFAERFPADDTAGGFDNNADVLSTSPLLVQKWSDAARDIAALVFPEATVATTLHVEAEETGGSVGGVQGERWNLWSVGTIDVSFSAPVAGRYALRVRAEPQAAGPDAVRMTVAVDRRAVQTFAVEELAVFSVEVDVAEGAHVLSASFDNDFYDPSAGQDRNLLVDWLEVTGPLDVIDVTTSPGRVRFVPCDENRDGVVSCARATLSPLLRRAFRRTVASDEIEPYVALVQTVVQDGDSFDAGLRTAVEAILLSPSFLFRAEVDVGGSAPRRLDPFELASRLSYFLWATMPDEELQRHAEDGSLSDPRVFAAEVERMMQDPRTQGGFVDAVAGQWLDARGIRRASPDPARFPLSAEVRAAMEQETLLVVRDLLRDERPLWELLTADFTYVNAALAAHYGFSALAGMFDDDADGDGFVRISLAGTNRRGILTHGAFLAGHSYPSRTSPVKRGRFVTDALLCVPPGDIPPGVPPLSDDATAGSLRQRMEQHRADPACAGCHALMDPVGFGLESFDPAGRSRTHDEDGYVIDDDDVIFDTAFSGPEGLGAVLARQPLLHTCASTRLGSYALGRGLDFVDEDDRCTIQDVLDRAGRAGFSLGDVIRAVTTADSFQFRSTSEEAAR